MKKLYTLTVAAFASLASVAQISLDYVSTYRTGIFDDGAAEIVTYDSASQTLVFSNASTNEIEFLDFSDPTNLTSNTVVDLSTYGGGVNSVSAYNGVVAVAIEANVKQDDGVVAFFNMSGDFISQVTVGALPDMVTFSPSGKTVVTANEGEPSDDYSVDPEGSVSIIDVSGGFTGLSQADVTTLDFNGITIPAEVRVFGPGATAAQDLEPEYVTISNDDSTAYVVLQENNGLAIVDLSTKTISAVVALGFKDHNVAGNGFDPSNRDDTIHIRNYPTKGMYQPDAIAYYMVGGQGYVVSANEGDSRDYGGFSEEERVKDLDLDSTVFTNASLLQEDEELGRLKTTSATGDANGDGFFEEIYSYGARSFSIWNGTSGELVWDSGDEFEVRTADAYPDDFNSNNDENDSFDNRSDDKGPEPEAVEVISNRGNHYALIGLERMGGIMVYDITNPNSPSFIEYVNNRDFSVVNVENAGVTNDSVGDLGIEDILYINDVKSPDNKHYAITSNEVSGTISVFEITGLLPVGTEEVANASNAFVVYPNPTSGVIRMNTVDSYEVYDVAGKLVGQYVQTQEVNLSQFQSGLYLVKNTNGEVVRVSKY